MQEFIEKYYRQLEYLFELYDINRPVNEESVKWAVSEYGDGFLDAMFDEIRQESNFEGGRRGENGEAPEQEEKQRTSFKDLFTKVVSVSGKVSTATSGINNVLGLLENSLFGNNQRQQQAALEEQARLAREARNKQMLVWGGASVIVTLVVVYVIISKTGKNAG